jgi:hypothetical protein
LQKLPFIGGLNNYQLNWIYRWQPLPHNWVEVVPDNGITDEDPKFTVDLWKGEIVVNHGDYSCQYVLKCNPFNYSSHRIVNYETPSSGTGDSGMPW